MASFSIKSFDKKLKEMSSRQDSVQTVSLWLIHHRAHSKSVVYLWLDRMKKAKPDRRLILFYLANDIIQNSRKKGKEYTQSFSKVLGDAMQYLRDTSIRPSVERVLKIWQERKVFEKDAVQKLLNQLNNASVKPKPKPKPEPSVPKKEIEKVKDEEKKKKKPKRPVPANFKTINVTRAMATMQEIEDETERRQTLVAQMRLDASSSEGIKQLKDYAGGNRFSLEFEESSTKYEELAESLQREAQHRGVLVDLLEDGDAYYQAALKEASLIANAYRSFGNRLHSMKKKLDNKIRKFATAEKEAPVSAPKASFLASGLSGILEQMNHSPAATPSRAEQEDVTKDEKETGNELKKKEGNKENLDDDGKAVDPTMDHVEVSDMDLDSDDGADDPGTAPQLSDSNSNTSAKSTPQPVPTPSPLATTPSPKVVAKVPASTTTTSQFGYTMTVNSAGENDDVESPASPESVPSPDGSPELNLEIYERSPATNALPGNQLGVMMNQSFIGNEPKLDPGAAGSHNTMNLLAQLISKQRRNDGSSVEGTDSPGRGSNTPNTPARDEVGHRPLANLLGDLLAPLVHSQDEVSQIGGQAEMVQEEAAHVGTFDHSVAPVSTLAEPATAAVAVAASKNDSGPSTDEEGEAGDNTPEHGVDYAQAPPIIIRSDSSFHPSFPGQAFQNRPPMARPGFLTPERMPMFPGEAGVFTRDGHCRPSMEEHFLRSPVLRSPRVAGGPIQWEQGSPFGPRGNLQAVMENRDPRLRRREQQMGRFIDNSPFMERGGQGRPPGMELRGDLRQGPPPMGMREDVEREEMMRRRLSGDEGDGRIPLEERERHMWEMEEGRPPLDNRPELRFIEGERQDGPYSFERRDMRGRFHPMERDADMRDVHPEVRDGPLYRIPPIERRYPPPLPMGRTELVGDRREPVPIDQRGQTINRIEAPHTTSGAPLDGPHPIEQRNQFHPPEVKLAPDEVPTSEEETSEINDKPPVGDLADGGQQRPPVQMLDGAHPEMGNKDDRFHNEQKFPLNECQTENEQGAMFRVDLRPPEIKPSGEGPTFRPRDGSRPIRVIGGPYGPRHDGPGRYPGPRNFHPNFRPRHFRPRYEHDRSRPHYPPMHGGPHLKRSGPPFQADFAKRPHY
ncbi:uncharacterized protein LOC114529484 [Dendronephthya gigantea]|uniref:uncharacterized protein LOC114529484 n=1 Tax=Dendronephthya gigantea TaxID=151771 RepID=UPI00106CCF3B|nr:uncharacterized protein LOC114529484 [Dendronephthya gigantea]